MIVNLQIPQPVIVSPQYFRVRYRIQGTTAWNMAANQTNAPFTLDLPAGKYDFEFTLIDGTKTCDSYVQQYEVVDTDGGSSPCIDFAGVIELDGRGYRMVITYTNAPVSSCGYILAYKPQGGNTVSQTYVSLPPSPIIFSPVQNVPYTVSLSALRCDGREVKCDAQTVNPVAPPTCTPATLIGVTVTQMTGVFYLRFAFSQSNPYTPSFNVNYSQNDIVLTGVPDPGGNVNLPAQPSSTVLFQAIQPNTNTPPVNGIQTFHYTGTFVDGCGVSHKWAASFDLT